MGDRRSNTPAAHGEITKLGLRYTVQVEPPTLRRCVRGVACDIAILSSQRRMVVAPLNAAERAVLHGYPFSEVAFRTYMKSHYAGARTDGNIRRTTETVHRLNTVGVTDPNAKGTMHPGGVNATNTRIQLDQDLEALRATSRAWLPADKDPGNGWAINHPVNRLIDYQRFCYDLVMDGKPLLDGGADDGQRDNASDDDDGVEITGGRTSEQRALEGQRNAIMLGDSDDDVDSHTPKRLKKQRPPASQTTPSTARGASTSERVQPRMTKVFSMQIPADAYSVSYSNGELSVYCRESLN